MATEVHLLETALDTVSSRQVDTLVESAGCSLAKVVPLVFRPVVLVPLPESMGTVEQRAELVS
jgi:hypothetical protein